MEVTALFITMEADENRLLWHKCYFVCAYTEKSYLNFRITG